MKARTKAAATTDKPVGKSVDSYVAGLADWQADIVTALRKIVREAAPGASESIKWAQPVYEDHGAFCWIKAHSKHVNIGFWRGATLKDSKGLLEGAGDRMRHVKVNSVKDIDKPALKDFVRQSVKLNRSLGDPTKGRM